MTPSTADVSDPEPAGWNSFAAAIEREPPERQASRFAQLALQMIAQGRQPAAARYAVRARTIARQHGTDDAAIVARALRQLTAKYHVNISTDPVRIAAWDAALRHRLRDGMLALEIGTGCGILAMLAARAGARVVTCENEAIIASVAEDVVAQNGLSDRIDIISKPVALLRLDTDLPRSADCLILDLFADSLFGFEPFKALREARPLLRPNAQIVPMRVALKAALAHYRQYARLCPGEIGGFDLRALSAVQRNKMSLDAHDPDLSLRSAPDTLLSIDLAGPLPDANGAVEATMASDGGEIDGLAVWIELTLAPGITLGARPGSAPHAFYARPVFHAFTERQQTTPGQPFTVRLSWNGKYSAVTRLA